MTNATVPIPTLAEGASPSPPPPMAPFQLADRVGARPRDRWESAFEELEQEVARPRGAAQP